MDAALWYCGVCSGVCNVVMERTTPAIACVGCRNWVHLVKCAGLNWTQAKKKKKTFKCICCADRDRNGIGDGVRD